MLNCLEGQWQEGTMLALNASDIISLVGIWGGNNSVWILRKHPGLAMLTPEECGIEDSDGGEGEIKGGRGVLYNNDPRSRLKLQLLQR